MTEELVIDIQGFVGFFEQFIPKEVSVLSVFRPYSESWLISPPYRFCELSDTAKRQNNWLTRNYHRLTWEDGEVPFHALPLLLCKATTNASVVYVRGKEKALYLQDIISTPVINLENLSPPFKRISAERHYCIFHGLVACELYPCAIQNTHKLKAWVVDEKAKNNPTLASLYSNIITQRDIRRLKEITANEISSEEEEEEDIEEENETEEEEFEIDEGIDMRVLY